jgi:hemoglobin/transferrin/lactoferrin receptor protein
MNRRITASEGCGNTRLARMSLQSSRRPISMRLSSPGALFGVALSMLFAGPALAQSGNRFEGRLVQQATGAPIADASVSIAGVNGSVRTDSDGRFSWVPAPPPPFQLIAILSGGQIVRPAIVESFGAAITLIPIGGLTDEALIVLGAAPSINTTPASATTILSGTQISQRNPEHLMQALETVPGINQVSEGHAAVPAVRGLARGRTLFLIDGGRVSAERRVGPSATFLDPSVVEGVDVARGPGSVAYGSDALGGVISVRTRRAEPGSALRTRFTGTLGAGVPEGRAAVEIAKGVARGGVLVQAHLRNASDYDGPDGPILNSGWEDQGFLVHLTHAVSKGFLSAAWQSDYGRDVERPRNNSQTVRFYYPYENSHRLTASYQVPEVAGFRQVTITAFLGTYDQRTDQDRLPTAATGRLIERADVAANDFHVKGSADRLVGPARFEVGVDVNGRYNLEALDVTQTFDLPGTLTANRVNVSIDDARRVDTGVYVEGESALGSLVRIAGGIRGDRVTNNNVGGFFGDRSIVNASASGFSAVTVTPLDGLSVTGQVSRGFRDPVLSDRYFRGPSGRGFITGNPDLKPETSLQFDLATRYTLARTQLAVYLYHYRIDDLVERYQPETDFFFFRNRGRATLRGAEIEARSELGRGYSLQLGAQIARGRAIDDGASLDDVSPLGFQVLGRKELGTRGYAQARVAWFAADNRPGPSELAAPGATLVDAGAGWRLLPQLELRGMLRNLLNESYYASPDPRWVPAPGRSANLTAVVQF